MLKYLHIENIAVIEQTDISFSDGLNVLTGETGAGKSIIIDSINAVLGVRTSKELIRAGCEKAVVSAVFGNLNGTVKQIISDQGFSADENGEYIIQRTLTQSGNNIRINGQPISASVLRSFSHLLINIHGQHETTVLTDSDNHFTYLDRLAENEDVLNEYRNEFKNFNSIRSRLKEIDCDEDEKLRRIDLLKYQIAELSGAGITVGEYDRLKENSIIARNIGKKIERLNKLLALISGSDDADGALSLISNLSLSAVGIIDNEKTLTDISSAEAALNSVKADVEDYLDKLNSDEFDADAIEARLQMLNELMRKYGNSEQKMLDFLNKAQEDLEKIDFDDSLAEKLAEELERSQDRLVAAADKLSLSRSKIARIFEQKVISILNELNMQNVRLSVKQEKGRYTKNGCDDIEFLISTNAGEQLKPLSKVASGGELSRIMLAIKSVFAEKDDVDTLIFDEIDTGISGITADSVGTRLQKLAAVRQTICVTHLAQIAVCADRHLLIEKNVRDERTFTSVIELNAQNRIAEIARIMGGTNINEQLLKTADDLIKSHSR